MRTDVLNWIEVDADNINNAFDAMEATLSYLNMKKVADDIIEELPEALSQKFDWFSPTKSIIVTMYTLATTKILEKYPNAKVTVKIPLGCHGADIDVDDDTIDLAEEERRKEYEE